VTEKFFQLKSFITYWLDAVDAHSLHSPFLYNLYTNVIHSKSKENDERFKLIEQIRNTLLKDKRVIQVSDFGSGSHVLKNSSRQIRDIARTGLSPAKYSNIYAQLVSYFKCKTIFDLGTSFGINTLYLAVWNKNKVTTFEGSTEVAAIAQQSFEKINAKNIRIVQGNLDTTLLPEIQLTETIDLVFMDANHRYEPTLRYFECLIQKMSNQGIIILDDIHYSPEMERAWNDLKKHARVRASADLYRSGILFFDPSLNNQHVVLQC
jgi:predicted O-methyltransferase YrrM